MSRFNESHSYDIERRQQQEIDEEKGIPVKQTTIVTEEPAEAERPEVRPAHRVHYGTAVIDVLIALLPLYFVVFAILAYIRNDTLANSFRNMAIMRMSKLKPTLFPIVFTLIVAKFLKACANWRLERGATVGLIQHLLGSRSLVSSVITPVKLRTTTFLVPLLILMWVLNPIGGQTSLRVVTTESNYTLVNTPFHYLDMASSVHSMQSLGDGQATELIKVDFNTALASPSSAKNGSQDSYMNLQIPMLEALQASETSDADGWFTTMGSQFTGVVAAIADALDVPQQAPQLLYSSLMGIPITRGSVPAASTVTANNDSSEAKLSKIKEDLFGSNVVSTQSVFNFETSYMYANCSIKRSPGTPPTVNYGNWINATKDNWGNSSGSTVSNTMGMTIAYNSLHNYNSTQARRIGFESWRGLPADRATMTWDVELSEAWCNLTTTYLEVQAYCSNDVNCTVAKVRPSKKSHPDQVLTVLDGTSYQVTGQEYDTEQDMWDSYGSMLAEKFFGQLINSTAIADTTGSGLKGPQLLTPLESYFLDPANPYFYATNPTAGVYTIGDKLFSTRFTQLLNTFWLNSVVPYTLISGLNVTQDVNDPTVFHTASNDGSVGTSTGQYYIETMVLRCHKAYFGILVVVSILLFLAGLATAYLDATRQGPDVLDDFVNSLRHSPFVHVDQGPSMEDGQEKARRLRQTVIQMGDVKPGDEYGYVAIGTPSEEQPVRRLDHRRYYE